MGGEVIEIQEKVTEIQKNGKTSKETNIRKILMMDNLKQPENQSLVAHKPKKKCEKCKKITLSKDNSTNVCNACTKYNKVNSNIGSNQSVENNNLIERPKS